MAETGTQILFSHQEIAEALIRKADLHEGIWRLHIEFGIAGGEITLTVGGNPNPAAIVPINRMGLRRVSEVDTLSADAAVVNPISDEPQRERRKIKR